jgi:hypothetical protein
MDDLKCTITLAFLMNLENLRLFIFTLKNEVQAKDVSSLLN